MMRRMKIVLFERISDKGTRSLRNYLEPILEVVFRTLGRVKSETQERIFEPLEICRRHRIWKVCRRPEENCSGLAWGKVSRSLKINMVKSKATLNSQTVRQLFNLGNEILEEVNECSDLGQVVSADPKDIKEILRVTSVEKKVHSGKL